jgi:hypothetical protein
VSEVRRQTPAPGGRRLLRRDVEEKLKEPPATSFNEEMGELQGQLGTSPVTAVSSFDLGGKEGTMTPRPLPRNPSVKLINDEARNLLYDFHQGNALAPARHSLFGALSDTASPRLADAQHLIAREYGFASWLKLKRRVDELVRGSDSSEELEGL